MLPKSFIGTTTFKRKADKSKIPVGTSLEPGDEPFPEDFSDLYGDLHDSEGPPTDSAVLTIDESFLKNAPRSRMSIRKLLSLYCLDVVSSSNVVLKMKSAGETAPAQKDEIKNKEKQRSGNVHRSESSLSDSVWSRRLHYR